MEGSGAWSLVRKGAEDDRIGGCSDRNTHATYRIAVRRSGCLRISADHRHVDNGHFARAQTTLKFRGNALRRGDGHTLAPRDSASLANAIEPRALPIGLPNSLT
jgi:hypothetical protein